MSKLRPMLAALIIGTSLSSISLTATAHLPVQAEGAQLPSLAPMLEKTAPAVVSISVAGTHTTRQRVPDAFRHFFGRQTPGEQVQERPFKGLGSGVIIDAEKGYVVTNHHVINDADEILVTLSDGRQFEAKRIGSDESSDIALLQIEDAERLTQIVVSDSDSLRVGDFVVAIGNPFGLGQTVTSGIVSALGRSGLNAQNYEDFIQTDASINSGNSGGALVNLHGELIGINTAIIGPSGGNVGIGFAIPSTMMNNLISQLVEFGEVRRGALGIVGGNLTSDWAQAMELDLSQGAFIQRVLPDTAASEAGLEAGDVIISINGKKVKTFNELRAKIATIGAGAKVELGYVRDGTTKTAKVTLKNAESSSIAANNLHPALEGATLTNGDSGVNVSAVADRSPAFQIGLEANDVIIGVNRKIVSNTADLRRLIEKSDGVIALNVRRGDSSLYIMIR